MRWLCLKTPYLTCVPVLRLRLEWHRSCQQDSQPKSSLSLGWLDRATQEREIKDTGIGARPRNCENLRSIFPSPEVWTSMLHWRWSLTFPPAGWLLLFHNECGSCFLGCQWSLLWITSPQYDPQGAGVTTSTILLSLHQKAVCTAALALARVIFVTESFRSTILPIVIPADCQAMDEVTWWQSVWVPSAGLSACVWQANPLCMGWVAGVLLGAPSVWMCCKIKGMS